MIIFFQKKNWLFSAWNLLFIKSLNTKLTKSEWKKEENQWRLEDITTTQTNENKEKQTLNNRYFPVDSSLDD